MSKVINMNEFDPVEQEFIKVEDVEGLRKYREKTGKIKNKVEVKKEYKKPNRTGNAYRIYDVRKDTIMNDTYRMIFNDKTSLYYFLKANIVRGKMFNDEYDILNKYYKKGMLACHFSEKDLAKHMNISRRQIRNWIEEFTRSGVIRVEKQNIRFNYTPNVFILGTWNMIEGKKKEYYYLENLLENK